MLHKILKFWCNFDSRWWLAASKPRRSVRIVTLKPLDKSNYCWNVSRFENQIFSLFVAILLLVVDVISGTFSELWFLFYSLVAVYISVISVANFVYLNPAVGWILCSSLLLFLLLFSFIKFLTMLLAQRLLALPHSWSGQELYFEKWS